MSDEKDDDIINLYETIPKKFKEEERHYDTEKEVNIKLPFMMCVTGATGSGKTNAVINIIRKINAFDKIMLWAKNTDEPLYAAFIDQLREVEKKTGASILSVSNTIDDLPDVKTINKDNTTLLLVDDMVTEKDKALSKVAEYWIRGRKQNCSCMFLSQSYFKIPKIIRDNSYYFIFAKIAGERDLQLILKDYKLGVTDDQLVELYNKATAGGYPNFFFVDVKTSDVDLRFRRNLKPMKLPAIKEGDKEKKSVTQPQGKRNQMIKAPYSQLSDTLSANGKQPVKTKVRDINEEKKKEMKEKEKETKENIAREKEHMKLDQGLAKLQAHKAKEDAKAYKQQQKEEAAEAKKIEKEILAHQKEIARQKAQYEREQAKHPFNRPEPVEMDNPHSYEQTTLFDVNARKQKKQKPKPIEEDDPYEEYNEEMGYGLKRRKRASSSKRRKLGGSLDSELKALIALVR